MLGSVTSNAMFLLLDTTQKQLFYQKLIVHPKNIPYSGMSIKLMLGWNTYTA
jgi:hypothetical protein